MASGLSELLWLKQGAEKNTNEMDNDVAKCFMTFYEICSVENKLQTGLPPREDRNANPWAGFLEGKTAAIVEDLGLSDGQNARACAGHRGAARGIGGVDQRPARLDDVRLAEAGLHDEVEAMGRQGAQDQFDVAQVVQADARSGRAAAREVRRAVDRRRRGEVARSGGSALSMLREQLGAELLEALVINHAGGRQYPRAAPVDRHTHLNPDVRRRARDACRDFGIGKKAGYQGRADQQGGALCRIR